MMNVSANKQCVSYYSTCNMLKSSVTDKTLEFLIPLIICQLVIIIRENLFE